MKRYKVICGSCRSVRQVGIIKGAMGEIIDWLDNLPDPQVVKIISGRKRMDNNFGWECVCGNNDLLTQQEIASIKNKSAPKPQELNQIMKNLKPQEPKFKMVAI